VEGLIHRGLLC
jgi:hypothetical protein